MLFNSYSFLLGFLPVVFVGFFLIARKSHIAAATWLALASIFFYGWWSVKAVPLLVGSVCFNYFMGGLLSAAGSAGGRDEAARKRLLLTLAVAANLLLLGFFKYANFFVANANAVIGAAGGHPLPYPNIVLPIGISFFTFTQIAFLVDCYQGKVRERRFAHYLLFVTYFPHLVAGPVLHHSQMMPQFAKGETYRMNAEKIAVGIAVFAIGLAKKLLIADPLGEHAEILFKSVADGAIPQFFMSWFGVLAYTFQIYFDFSGYSDMAIGLSLLFGIHLPINFNSPYKSVSIIEFWRRWHISLSTFLRDYLYIALGGNRHGKIRRYINLFLTMLLGGLWHGASWTFVLWGGLHGMYLVINHAWRKLAGEQNQPGLLARGFGWLITFLAVCFAWVLFRADSLRTAAGIYRGMLGQNGVSLPDAWAAHVPRQLRLGWLYFNGFYQNLPLPEDYNFATFMRTLCAAAVISLAAPPVASLFQGGGAAFRAERVALLFDRRIAVALGCLLTLGVFSISKVSPFLYFQF